MNFTSDKIIYTRYDELPNCNVCDNKNDQACCNRCGAQHGWVEYNRSVSIDDLRCQILNMTNDKNTK